MLWASLYLLFILGLALPANAAGKKLPDGVQRIGTIKDPGITECSGVVASRQFPGVLWTHNDGGGRRAALYAMNKEGVVTARFPITAFLDDWEDLALDEQKQLYIADTGNNEQKRQALSVHQLDEPDPSKPNSRVGFKKSWVLTFPGKPFDSEALFIWGEFGYLITKVSDDQAAELYRFPLASSTPRTVLTRVAELPITSPVAGADISPDGSVIGVVAKAGAFAFTVGGKIEPSSFAKSHRVKYKHDRIEGCCFVPGGLLVTAESREIFLFADAPFQTKP